MQAKHLRGDLRRSHGRRRGGQPRSGRGLIPPAKLAALRKRLEEHGEAAFANGAKVRRVVEVKLVVEGFNGAVTTVGDETNLELAYELALHGPRQVAQPKGDPAKFGDDRPF